MSDEEIRTHALVMATAMKVVCGDIWWEEELYSLAQHLDYRAATACDADVSDDLGRLSAELYRIHKRGKV